MGLYSLQQGQEGGWLCGGPLGTLKGCPPQELSPRAPGPAAVGAGGRDGVSQGQAVPEEGQAGPCSPTRVSPARSLRATVVVWLQVTFGVRHLFLQAVLLLSPPRAGTSLQDGPRCPVGASSELSTSCPHVALAPQPHRRPFAVSAGTPRSPRAGWRRHQKAPLPPRPPLAEAGQLPGGCRGQCRGSGKPGHCC